MNMDTIKRRIHGRWRILWSRLRYSWCFGSFGKRSIIDRPDMLTNAQSIHIGDRVEIRKGARLEVIKSSAKVDPIMTIGEGTSIHLYFHCGAAHSVTIGKNVLIAGRVYITDHDHVFDDPNRSVIDSKRLRSDPVVIEDGVWLGEGCVILKGVTVGKRSVVGANAVVTKNVPPYTVVGGVPARVIRKMDKVQEADEK